MINKTNLIILSICAGLIFMGFNNIIVSSSTIKISTPDNNLDLQNNKINGGGLTYSLFTDYPYRWANNSYFFVNQSAQDFGVLIIWGCSGGTGGGVMTYTLLMHEQNNSANIYKQIKTYSDNSGTFYRRYIHFDLPTILIKTSYTPDKIWMNDSGTYGAICNCLNSLIVINPYSVIPEMSELIKMISPFIFIGCIFTFVVYKRYKRKGDLN